MIGNVMPALAHMEPELVKCPAVEIKEIIEGEPVEAEMPARTFSIVDLWNIRRNANTAKNCFRG